MNRAVQPPIRLPVIVMAALLAAGCTVGATTEPEDAAVLSPAAATPVPASPSPPPTPEPSTGPAEAFETLAASDDWAFMGDLTGRVVTNMDSNYVNPVTGYVMVGGGDAVLVVGATDPAGLLATEERRVGGERWIRERGRVREEPSEVATRDLLGALLDIGPVEVVGSEFKLGQDLTVLEAAMPVELGTLSGVRAEEAAPQADLQILVDDDGWPVLLRVQPGPFAIPGQASGASLESLTITVLERGGAMALGARPPDPWQEYASAEGYRLWLPQKCELDVTWTYSEFFFCTNFTVEVFTNDARGRTQEEWARDSIAEWSGKLGASPGIEYVLRVGRPDDSEPGWIATYRYEGPERDMVLFDAVFVHDDAGFDVNLKAWRSGETMARALFLQVLATLEFTE